MVKGKNARVRQIISERGREYRERSVLCCKEQEVFGSMLKSRLNVKITLNPPTRHKRDIDNYCKATLDALTHAKVWVDDEQIDELNILRGSIMKGGNTVVEIEEINTNA